MHFPKLFLERNFFFFTELLFLFYIFEFGLYILETNQLIYLNIIYINREREGYVVLYCLKSLSSHVYQVTYIELHRYIEGQVVLDFLKIDLYIEGYLVSCCRQSLSFHVYLVTYRELYRQIDRQKDIQFYAAYSPYLPMYTRACAF